MNGLPWLDRPRAQRAGAMGDTPAPSGILSGIGIGAVIVLVAAAAIVLLPERKFR